MSDFSSSLIRTFGPSLPLTFFERDPVDVAPDLLGTILVSIAGDRLTAGRIVETEAYRGSHDPGSHAATKGVTARNIVMYSDPGTVYVYFTYGNHHMINLVCEPSGTAGAVLIRALEPLEGVEIMQMRRGRHRLHDLCSGPGKLAQALGVDLSDNGSVLGLGRLQVYAGERPSRGDVVASGRIGLREGHDLPYRFYESNNPFVSRARTGPAAVRRRRAENGGGSSR